MEYSDVLVIGNGFDLYCGLKTRYNDFFNYCNQKLNQNDLDFKKYSNNFWVNFFCEFYYKINTWGNFEEIIGLVMSALNKAIDYAVITEIRDINVFGFTDLPTNPTFFIKFNEDEVAKYTNIERLIIKCIKSLKNDRPFRKFDNSYAVTCADNLLNLKDKIFELIEEDLNEISNLFSVYLNENVNNCISNISDEVVEKLRQINPKYIISFNYTNTPKYVYGEDSKILYIHGSTLENNVIFGSRRVNDNQTIKFSKLYRSIKILPNINYTSELFALEHIDGGGYFNEVKISFIGFSFDESDAEFIKNILNNASLFRRFSIYYYDEEAKNSILRNIISIISEENVNYWFSNNRIKFIKIN